MEVLLRLSLGEVDNQPVQYDRRNAFYGKYRLLETWVSPVFCSNLSPCFPDSMSMLLIYKPVPAKAIKFSTQYWNC